MKKKKKHLHVKFAPPINQSPSTLKLTHYMQIRSPQHNSPVILHHTPHYITTIQKIDQIFYTINHRQLSTLLLFLVQLSSTMSTPTPTQPTPQHQYHFDLKDPKDADYDPIEFTKPESTDELPNCDMFLEQYMRCVNSKNGLTHVDDCPYEALAYKECIEVEKERGMTIRQRYYRDSTFWDLALDNIKVKMGLRSGNPDHKTYMAKPTPIVIYKNEPV